MGTRILDTTFVDLLSEMLDEVYALRPEHPRFLIEAARALTDWPKGEDPPARSTISKVLSGKLKRPPSLPTIDEWIQRSPLDDERGFRMKLRAMVERADDVERPVLEELIRRARL